MVLYEATTFCSETAYIGACELWPESSYEVPGEVFARHTLESVGKRYRLRTEWPGDATDILWFDSLMSALRWLLVLREFYEGEGYFVLILGEFDDPE